jgi:hypothetical protein
VPPFQAAHGESRLFAGQYDGTPLRCAIVTYMADPGVVVGLAGVVSGALVALGSAYLQWRQVSGQQRAETARVGWGYAEEHLTLRIEAYGRLLAFLARIDDWNSRTPVIRVEERDDVLNVFARVMLLGTPAVRTAAERLLGGFFGTSQQVGPVSRGWAPEHVRAERVSISREELDAGMPALLEAMRADVAEAEARWRTAVSDLTGRAEMSR